MVKLELQFSLVRGCLTEKLKHAQRSKGSKDGSETENPEEHSRHTACNTKSKCPEAGMCLVSELEDGAETVKHWSREMMKT